MIGKQVSVNFMKGTYTGIVVGVRTSKSGTLEAHVYFSADATRYWLHSSILNILPFPIQPWQGIELLPDGGYSFPFFYRYNQELTDLVRSETIHPTAGAYQLWGVEYARIHTDYLSTMLGIGTSGITDGYVVVQQNRDTTTCLYW